MKPSTTAQLLTLAALLALAGAAQASQPAQAGPDRALPAAGWLLAQAAPPAPSASAPATEAQPDNRDAAPRPAARRRGVGVVISMNVA